MLDLTDKEREALEISLKTLRFWGDLLEDSQEELDAYITVLGDDITQEDLDNLKIRHSEIESKIHFEKRNFEKLSGKIKERHKKS